MWSDASYDPLPGRPFGSGHVGFVVKVPREGGAYAIYFAQAVASNRLLAALYDLRAQKTFIRPLELLGIPAPYFTPALEDEFGGAFVLHFGDNNAANSATIKGTSRAEDMARLVHSFRLRTVSRQTSVWVEWVPSALNIGDAPSRPERDAAGLLSSYGAIRVPLDLDMFLEILTSRGLSRDS